MRRCTYIATALAIAGCSTGIVPTDQGKYMVSYHGGAGMSSESLKADAYKEANAFCAKSGQVVQTDNTKTQGMIPFVHGPSATLEFRCVPLAPPPAASAP